jgi:hypothetical protein
LLSAKAAMLDRAEDAKTLAEQDLNIGTVL